MVLAWRHCSELPGLTKGDLRLQVSVLIPNHSIDIEQVTNTKTHRRHKWLIKSQCIIFKMCVQNYHYSLKTWWARSYPVAEDVAYVNCHLVGKCALESLLAVLMLTEAYAKLAIYTVVQRWRIFCLFYVIWNFLQGWYILHILWNVKHSSMLLENNYLY